MIQSQERKRDGGRSSTRQRYRRAIIVSIVFHVCLLLVLLVRYFPSSKTVADAPSTRSNQAVALSPPPPVPVARDVDVPAEQIKASLKAQTEAVAKASDEQKLKELDKNLQQLDRVSDVESVDKVAKAIADSMGIDQNQYSEKPKPTDGVFDFDTAQLKNVTRTQDESGKWSYAALMVDLDGHEQAVPISEVEGKPAYEVFEKLKQYPMAESLYRQLVMPMIQQVLEPKKP